MKLYHIASIIHNRHILTTCPLQKMSALRIEADEAHASVEELKAKVKSLEQENLAKEQEITSLSHKNQLLEADVEKLETQLKEAKEAADQGATHGSANESLTRRLQLLEEEAEQADRNLREINEKYAAFCRLHSKDTLGTNTSTGTAKPTSKPVTMRGKSRP